MWSKTKLTLLSFSRADLNQATWEGLSRLENSSMTWFWSMTTVLITILSGTISRSITLAKTSPTSSTSLTWLNLRVRTTKGWNLSFTRRKRQILKVDLAGRETARISVTTKTAWKRKVADFITLLHFKWTSSMTMTKFIFPIATLTHTPTAANSCRKFALQKLRTELGKQLCAKQLQEMTVRWSS